MNKMKKLSKPQKYIDNNVEFYATEVTPVSPISPMGGVTPSPAPNWNYNSGNSSSSSSGSFLEIFTGILNKKK